MNLDGAWEYIYPGCTKGLQHDVCETCYEEGIIVYIFLCITMAVQLPLIYLVLQRTDPVQDSRLLKFWFLPIGGIVIVGSALSRHYYEDGCEGGVSDTFDMLLDMEFMQQDHSRFLRIFNNQHTAGYVPVLAALLTAFVSAVSLLTPVPELYQDTYCSDPVSSEDLILNDLAGFAAEIKTDSDTISLVDSLATCGVRAELSFDDPTPEGTLRATTKHNRL